MLLGSDILRLFFTGPYLVSLPLCSVSGVDCPSVDPRQPLLPASLLSCDQLPTLVLASLWAASSTLILGSPYHFRIRRDFMSKNPLSGFAPKQTRLLWRPAPIVLHLFEFCKYLGSYVLMLEVKPWTNIILLNRSIERSCYIKRSHILLTFPA